MTDTPQVIAIDCATGEAIIRPATLDELAQLAIDAALPAPPPPPPSIPEQVSAALHALDPATTTVSEVLAALTPIFPTPPS